MDAGNYHRANARRRDPVRLAKSESRRTLDQLLTRSAVAGKFADRFGEIRGQWCFEFLYLLCARMTEREFPSVQHLTLKTAGVFSAV